MKGVTELLGSTELGGVVELGEGPEVGGGPKLRWRCRGAEVQSHGHGIQRRV